MGKTSKRTHPNMHRHLCSIDRAELEERLSEAQLSFVEDALGDAYVAGYERATEDAVELLKDELTQ